MVPGSSPSSASSDLTPLSTPTGTITPSSVYTHQSNWHYRKAPPPSYAEAMRRSEAAMAAAVPLRADLLTLPNEVPSPRQNRAPNARTDGDAANAAGDAPPTYDLAVRRILSSRRTSAEASGSGDIVKKADQDIS